MFTEKEITEIIKKGLDQVAAQQKIIELELAKHNQLRMKARAVSPVSEFEQTALQTLNLVNRALNEFKMNLMKELDS